MSGSQERPEDVMNGATEPAQQDVEQAGSDTGSEASDGVYPPLEEDPFVGFIAEEQARRRDLKDPEYNPTEEPPS
ncbi:hypothetical protein ACP70R_020758 [Stipagrostis hirtigluma subsp. patula]